ncbi:Box C/D snoRNA protein 1 [Desmophyllum pertusum]|uniref:Box C/D snoRNA protein 1 n=1 Tax=Desmophyllum pertusum TaxID=174260 RepID=A0A9W9ZGW4_9CNID|nr:Box C/D snoRNA protein 1 [Desmophyllum pertusum]
MIVTLRIYRLNPLYDCYTTYLTTDGRLREHMACMEDKSCVICGKSNPRYRCPACARRTCSLRCVKCHKMQFQCSGVRCKTKFVSLDKYTDSNLLSDYKFLENVDRSVYSAAHDSHSKYRRWNSQILYFSRKAKQSGVNLRLMPVGMSKRKENTSMFSRKEKCIMWRIQWLFPQAGVEYVDRWVSELAVVRDVLKKYIDPEQADAVSQAKFKELL